MDNERAGSKRRRSRGLSQTSVKRGSAASRKRMQRNRAGLVRSLFLSVTFLDIPRTLSRPPLPGPAPPPPWPVLFMHKPNLRTPSLP